MINLRKITEDNFLDAFRLKLAEGQEEYVSHPIRSLAQRMFIEISASHLEFMLGMKWLVM